jgi:hypothetical protein
MSSYYNLPFDGNTAGVGAVGELTVLNRAYIENMEQFRSSSVASVGKKAFNKNNKYGKTSSKILNELTQNDIWQMCKIYRCAIGQGAKVIEADGSIVQSIEAHLDANNHLKEIQLHKLYMAVSDALFSV